MFLTNGPPERWINCANGLLDQRSGELLPHTPDVATTCHLSVPWNSAATCPSVIELAREVIGVAIYADLALAPPGWDPRLSATREGSATVRPSRSGGLHQN